MIGIHADDLCVERGCAHIPIPTAANKRERKPKPYNRLAQPTNKHLQLYVPLRLFGHQDPISKNTKSSKGRMHKPPRREKSVSGKAAAQPR